jgi:hypothetical protein
MEITTYDHKAQQAPTITSFVDQVKALLKTIPFSHGGEALECAESISPCRESEISANSFDGHIVVMASHGRCEGMLVRILSLSNISNDYLELLTIKYISTTLDEVSLIASKINQALHDGR